MELPRPGDVPPAPDWLPNEAALAEWNRLAPILHAVGLLTEPALAPLAHLCALHGTMVRAWSAGQPPNAAQMRAYRALVNDFGIPPAAQGKVNPRRPRPANRFDAIGKRP